MRAALVMALALMLPGAVAAQTAPPTPPARPRGPPVSPPLGAGPWDLATEEAKLHVSVVTRGLDHPWALVFLPDGDMLVTERPGRLRVVRNGVLDPTPIAGLPDIYAQGLGGLLDVALHPKFKRNHLVYFAYVKPGTPVREQATLAVARARWDGGPALADVRDIFVADAWYGAAPLPKRCCGQGPATGSHGSRILFDKKGHLFVTSGDRNYGEKVQDPSNDFGKIVRLTDTGGVPRDNPFVGRPGWRPEIWTLGHRNPLGLFIDPKTGLMWESEFGPRGGDEVNIIRRGHNYGWIDVTQGQHYNGEAAKGVRGVPGMDDPAVSFAPSINPGNLLIYRGTRFPQWQGDLVMGDMTRSVLRARIGPNGEVGAQERMLTELKQRFRDVRLGPDGDLYLLTDEADGAILKVEPAKGN